MATLATTVVVVLVNGREIARTIFQTPVSGGTDEDAPPPQDKKYFLQVQTLDASGSIREKLDTSTADHLTIKAVLIDAETGTMSPTTQSISFWLISGNGWVTLAVEPYGGGAKTAMLAVVQPLPGGTPPTSVVVGFGGQNVQESVTIALEGQRYVLEVT